MSLQPIEEFWEQADEDLKAKALSNGAADGDDAMEEGGLALPPAEWQRKEQHVLMLARLEHETRLRKRQAADLDLLKTKKTSLQQKVLEKERKCKGIISTIQEIEAASSPLQPFSDPDHTTNMLV